jgi:dual specificity tyrosine-phosphorylation-regulated kinase 2/3/4
VEIGYISLQPSTTRKSEQFSGLASPKSVIKGTPKVVMVPVDEDEEPTKFPMRKDLFT